MTKVEYAVQWCIAIANSPEHGYDQANRWGPDYDCSSLIITAYENAGIPVKSVGGAQRTYDMRTTFKKCGFYEVPYWDKNTGAGLQRGDVVLNVNHHVELYIGNNQLLKASQNEFGGSMGGQVGDQTGNEIRIGGYYLYPSGWDCALRYGNPTEEYTGSATTFPTVYEYATTGTVTSVEPNYQDIDAYAVTIDRKTKALDTAGFSKLGVMGSLIEAGFLFDDSHMEVTTYVNPKLSGQVATMNEAKIPYGLYGVVKARTVAEANAEIRWFRIYLQKYNPRLGAWLKLSLTKNKTVNDQIIKAYRDMLVKAGFKAKMGIYATKPQLSLISWDKWCDEFALWLISPISNVSEIEQLLTPEFFVV